MAKVRVYELAKELNMESKELVEKLQSGGVNIKNYMSTLDEDAVVRAKEIASGIISEVIEEKRIKPTVIRRRKKIKVKEEAAELKVEAEVTEPGKKEIEPSKPSVPFEEIKEVRKVKVTPLESLKETKEAREIKKELVDKKVAETKKVTRKKVSPLKEVKSEKISVKEEKPVSAEKEFKLKRIEKDKLRKVKKKKIEKPAKIIRTAAKVVSKKVEVIPPKEKPVTPSTDELDVTLRAQLPESLEIVEEITEEDKKQKISKKKKDLKTAEIKELGRRGIFRRRRKEVYERADLYEDRGISRKITKIGKKTKAEAKKGKQTKITVPKAIKRRIKVPHFVMVAELAKAMGVKVAELIGNLFKMGQMVNISQSIDFETASVVADEFGYELELDTFEEIDLIAETEDSPENLKLRPPVVTIMGHVDHGKTLLLDFIRKSNIIGGESGGITQHIGAYYVKGEEGDIVFLDTPGHEAFTAMRARGAEVTDIIVLVVAADDGVMPQTKEAINHARAANIPIVVAINKMDKPEANPEKVKRDLAALGVAAEDWGGETLFAQVSAKTGQGVDELLNLILLQAEMLELRANPDKKARGTVIEAKLDKSKGPVATVLIKTGTLLPGYHFICGEYFGRVRAMLNHRGKKMIAAGPSVPVEIYGISGVPMAGDEFIVVEGEKTAKQISQHRKRKNREQEKSRKGVVSLDDLFEKIKEGEVKELNIILKTDVQGSLEALADLLVKQSTEEVKLKIIHMATGAITESDVMLASASNAIIIGFNVRANPRVSELAKIEKIDIRYYDVIYNAVNDIRKAMTGLLEPVYEEHIIGRALIKQIFHIPKVGAVAGCHVSDGHVERNANARLLRDDVVVFDGKISSLKRFKDDVKEVHSGYECGISLENYNDIKPGDVFEVYQVEEVEAQL